MIVKPAARASIMLVIIACIGCSIQPTGSRSAPPGSVEIPAGSKLASSAPEQIASPTVDASPGPGFGFSPDTIAVVVTSDLVVRSLPEISDRSTIDPVYLQDGQLLFVLVGPKTADGYQWYQVVPFDSCPTCNDTPSERPPLLGWVAAAGPDGEDWIAPFSEPCADPQSRPAHWRPGLIALACLGSRNIMVEGALAGCAGIVPGFVEPAWLAEGGCELTPPGFDPTEGGGIGPGNVTFHRPPDLVMPNVEPGAEIHVVGHLDDPASA